MATYLRTVAFVISILKINCEISFNPPNLPINFLNFRLLPQHYVFHLFAAFPSPDTLQMTKEECIRGKKKSQLCFASPIIDPSKIPFPTRFLILSDTYPKGSNKKIPPNRDKFPRHLYKLEKQFDIVFVPYWSSKSKSALTAAFQTYFPFGMVPTTLILVVNACPICDSQAVASQVPSFALLMPVTKIILNCESLSSLVVLYSSNSTDSYITSVISDPIPFTDNPVALHKSLFWRWSNIPVVTLVPDRFHFVSSAHQKFCLENSILKTFSKHCTFEIMATEYIANIHNMTLTRRDRELMQSANRSHVMKYNNTFIDTMITRDKQYKYNYHQLTGNLFNKFKTTTISYCNFEDLANTRKKVHFRLWTQGFALNFWELLLGIILCHSIVTALVETKRVSLTALLSLLNQLFLIYKLVLKKGVIRNKKYLGLAFVLMYVGLLYENVILSLITSKLPPERFETLKELLANDYKILWKRSTTTEPWEKTHFQLFFKRAGVLDKLQSSFYLLDNATHKSLFLVKSWIEYGKKFAIYHDTVASTENFFLGYKQAWKKFHIGQSLLPYLYCHLLKEETHPRMSNWIIYTVNRPWIMKTLRWMEDTGLKNIWDEWSRWKWKLENGLLVDDETVLNWKGKIKPDYIRVSHVLGLLLVCGCMCATALIVFALELTIHTLPALQRITKIKPALHSTGGRRQCKFLNVLCTWNRGPVIRLARRDELFVECKYVCYSVCKKLQKNRKL